MEDQASRYDADIYDADIHCPMFGGQLAGGHWPAIEALIWELWIDNGINVFVYDYEPNPARRCVVAVYEPQLEN